MHGETRLVSHPKVTPRPLCPLDDYKEFGVNCEKMASEIEDHILWGGWEPPGSVCWATHMWAQEWWWGQDGGWWGQEQRVAGTRTEGDELCCLRCLQREPRPRLEADADAEQRISWAPTLVRGGLCVPPQTPLLRDLPLSLGK